MGLINDHDTRKLLEHEAKVRAIINAYHSEEIDTSYPVNILLSLTNNCNMDCVWCSFRALPSYELPFESVKRLCKEIKEHPNENSTLRGIVLQGWGEPTVYPRFMDVVSLFGEQGISQGLITNGLIVDYLNVLQFFSWIRISLDVTNPNQYEKFKKRPGDQFYIIMQNISDIARRKGNTRLGIAYLLTKYNMDGLEDLTMQIRDLGVDYLFIRLVGAQSNLRPLRRINLDSLKKYENNSFKVVLWYEDKFKKVPSIFSRTLPCYSHSAKIIISPNGDIHQCQMLPVITAQPIVKKIKWLVPGNWFIAPIGNINYQDFHDIWDGRQRLLQSERLLYRKLPFPCKLCCMYRYNLLIHSLISGTEVVGKRMEVQTSGFI